ncbi:MAG: holo-ACP synthase [candidate division KSB1 bacterium]|nr:holo-ACP synthase [candidate division KSB1 bacterium]MDZ7275853.1 holo-ACP synthase [candidate division KSB1 bacterium]MDZ7287603.1 holo-ACP synthase [candidate division KSB1 bacterium]MDZ7306493.1 holo-ACP synthase [candidate division KSB1 bacterium]MDZ7350581.1 holo-ACP synthase [candidate division KSB1 bacterium]
MICGIGIDLVEIPRLAALLQRWPQRFPHKVFTREEIAYCEGRGRRAASYAARFAAKEAFAKALGTGWSEHFLWKEFAVCNDADGRPRAVLSPRLQTRLQDITVHVSLSHADYFATAVVILEKPDRLA